MFYLASLNRTAAAFRRSSNSAVKLVSAANFCKSPFAAVRITFVTFPELSRRLPAQFVVVVPCIAIRPFFFLEAFCDISHRLGGITPFGVFSDAFPGLKMLDTFACYTAKILTHFIISIALLKNVPPDAGLQKRATFPHQT
jgi:hypothetical protein